jgi:hypothetical protein
VRYLAELTLAGLLPSPDARDEVLGDLAEEEQHLREQRSRRHASAWYRAEATRTAAQLIIRGAAARPRDVVTSVLAGALVVLAVQGIGTVLTVATVVGWPWGVSLSPDGLVPLVATAAVMGAVAGGGASALLARRAPLVPVAWLAILAALSSPLLEPVTVMLASAPELVGWPATLLPSTATTTLTLAIALPLAILLGGLGVQLPRGTPPARAALPHAQWSANPPNRRRLQRRGGRAPELSADHSAEPELRRLVRRWVHHARPRPRDRDNRRLVPRTPPTIDPAATT